MWQIANNYPTNHGAFFLYGIPGTGKSLISDMFACTGPIHYIDEWDPTDPGDIFRVLYSKINPTEEKPLIVLLDEVDKILEKIFYRENFQEEKKNKTEEKSFEIRTQIKGKKDWNKFFTDFTTKGKYKNTILIMASNKSKAYVDGLDPAYMRPGRVDKCWEITPKMIEFFANGVKEKDE
jgi:ATP-dependent 26S proteasome regulatory subunit